MQFEHRVVDPSPPCGRLFACHPVDLTGNGVPDLIVGGLGAEKLPVVGRSGLPFFGRFFRRLEEDLFWYENPGPGRREGGWDRHVISPRSDLLALGSTLGDVTGDGRLDLLVGQGVGGRDLYWFERPDDPRGRWREHRIDAAFEKYHDLTFGDIDDDGEPELVGASQRSEVVFYYDIPVEPRRSPWPERCRHVIDRGTSVEGLSVVDIDGDGRNELVAGGSIYRHDAASGQPASTGALESDGGTVLEGGWRRENIAEGWEWTRVAVGDIDDDGDLEVVLAEGDAPHLGGEAGRVAWFDPPEWTPHLLAEDCYCPHSLQLADFDGNGRLDVYVGEMGLGENEDAEHIVYRNLGEGTFEATTTAVGVPTHEARAADVDGDGRVDVIGKSYSSDIHVDVWYNQS